MYMHSDLTYNNIKSEKILILRFLMKDAISVEARVITPVFVILLLKTVALGKYDTDEQQDQHEIDEYEYGVC